MPDRKIASDQLLAAVKAFDDFARSQGQDGSILTVSLSEAGLHLSTQFRGNLEKTEITLPFLLSVSEWKAAREAGKTAEEP